MTPVGYPIGLIGIAWGIYVLKPQMKTTSPSLSRTPSAHDVEQAVKSRRERLIISFTVGLLLEAVGSILGVRRQDNCELQNP